MNEPTAFDYSLLVNGDEQHFPVAPFMFDSREDALAVARRQAVESAGAADVVVISTYASVQDGLAGDPSTKVEHHAGLLPEEWRDNPTGELPEPATTPPRESSST